MGKLNDLNEARAEDAEARAWKCESCDVLVETEGKHCSTCAQYWKDVEDGAFDYDDMEEKEYCYRCQNTGWVNCHCGGDLCVCRNQGEMPCPKCSIDGW